MLHSSSSFKEVLSSTLQLNVQSIEISELIVPRLKDIMLEGQEKQ